MRSKKDPGCAYELCDVYTAQSVSDTVWVLCKGELRRSDTSFLISDRRQAIAAVLGDVACGKAYVVKNQAPVTNVAGLLTR